MLPVLHFSGAFRFAMPGYNNKPERTARRFDPALPRRQVVALCGCDPARYFELELEGATVRQVTYADGTTAIAGDPVLGLPVTLAGVFPDVSPSAVCSQLCAARMKVGTALGGTVRRGLQSTPRLNVRPEGYDDDTVAAHVRTVVDLTSLPGLAGSRFVSELGGARSVELHLHLNRYTRPDAASSTEAGTGDAYGTVRPVGDEVDGDGRRLRRRKLVVHPDLPPQGWFHDTFLAAPPRVGTYPPAFWVDIEGFYDLAAGGRVVTLHYLDFVPYLDLRRTTPDVDHYEVWWDSAEGRIALGRFAGTHDEMVRTAGVVVLRAPDGAELPAGGRLVVDVVRKDDRQPLMVETEWDLVLEDERGFALPSTGSRTVGARVYRHNRPVVGHRVRLRAESRNRKSPVVATFAGDHAVSDETGRVSATVQAADLDRPGGVFDPVTDAPATAPLERSRYYGNHLFLEIDNPLRRNPWREDATEVAELSVRVLHRVDPAAIPARPTFSGDVRPLFTYHARYFPWLHVRDVGGRYVQFLDVDDLGQMRARAQEVLRRLSLPDDDPQKMPRSRDLPIGAEAVLRRWIDTGMAP